MRSLAERWNHFWFEPSRPTNLGVCRLVVLGGAFLFYLGMDFSVYGEIPASYWEPIPLFRKLHLPLLAPGMLWALGMVFKAALLLGALGIFSRISALAAFVLGVYLLGVPNNVGKTDHYDAVLIFAFGILAASRCGDAWSISALVRAARTSDRSPPPPSAEYTWPIRLMWVLIALIFFNAGVSKLRESGLEWAFSDSLQNLFLQRNYTSTPPLNWGIYLADYPLLCHLMALSVLVVEIGMPVALFSRVARRIIVPAAIVLQVGNELLLDVAFRQFMLAYLFFVPWDALGERLRAMASGRGVHHVIYDGSCGLCRRTMAVIAHLDIMQRVVILDAFNGWAEVEKRFPALKQMDCLETMHAIDPARRVTTGFYAYRTLAWALPLGWIVLPLLYVPGVPQIGSAVYRKVAARRLTAGCGVEGQSSVAS